MKFEIGQEISSRSLITDMLTNGLGNAPGDLEVAKVLRGGSLFLKDKKAGALKAYVERKL